LLFGAFTVYLSTLEPVDAPWLGLCCVLVLLGSVMLHEMGHVFVARRLGGVVDEVVIGPLGGLTPVRIPHEPQCELVALMAGPLVNLGIWLLAAAFLWFHDVNLLGLLNPLLPADVSEEGGAGVVFVKLLFWINWILILVNLIPTYPFDGGRALRAALMFAWPECDARQSLIIVARIAKVAALILLIVACFSVNRDSSSVVPTWFALTLLAIFVFFSARKEEEQADAETSDDAVFGYDFSQGYTSLERTSEKGAATTPANGWVRWLERRRALRQQRQREQEVAEDSRVDEILARLHQHGMVSLSREDRELLERVSARYRGRPS
jgi:Zn-dependent protease